MSLTDGSELLNGSSLSLKQKSIHVERIVTIRKLFLSFLILLVLALFFAVENILLFISTIPSCL